MGQLGDKIQRIKDLEITADSRRKFGVAEEWIAMNGGLFGTVEHLPLIVDGYDTLEAERTANRRNPLS